MDSSSRGVHVFYTWLLFHVLLLSSVHVHFLYNQGLGGYDQFMITTAAFYFLMVLVSIPGLLCAMAIFESLCKNDSLTWRLLGWLLSLWALTFLTIGGVTLLAAGEFLVLFSETWFIYTIIAIVVLVRTPLFFKCCRSSSSINY